MDKLNLESADTGLGRYVANNVGLLLKIHNMTGMDLARKIDISPSWIGNLVKNRANPTMSKLENVANAFGYKAWVLHLPNFNPNIPQEQYDKILEAFLRPELDDNQRGSIIAFAEFQKNSS